MNLITDKLFKKTSTYFQKHYNEDFVVKPSLPILYFGNLEEYFKSNLKIITVGKNPSDNEFKLRKNDKYSFCRFKDWVYDKNKLLYTLNSYFEEIPLKQWFSSFEPILNGLDCSFYKNDLTNSTAIHTDICSPIATNPTWSKLSSKNQELLSIEGIAIWKELIEELQPDIMLISVPQKLFSEVIIEQGALIISFDKKKDNTPRKYPYEVFIHKHKLKTGKTVNVVFGQAANKPFDTISEDQKKLIGTEIDKKMKMN
jgi:hypothetical protein